MTTTRHQRRPLLKFAVAGIALLAVASVFTACSSDSSSSSGAIKAAWIYVGPTNDGGWTQAHDAGRKFVATELGNEVVTTYKENVPEGPEVAQVIADLVKDGNKIIFGTSYGFQDAMAEAAAKYPDVKFEQATGDKLTGGKTVPKNYAELWGAGEDTLYLSGIAAGKATKNNKIGIVAPFAIPEVIRHINAFTLGAQSVNPNATTKVVWTKTWFNPTVEKQASESLVSAGVDVLFTHQDSPAGGDVAKAANIPWVGYDSDQSGTYGSVWLTTATYNWGPYYLSRVNAVKSNTWKQANYYGTIADNFTSLAPFGTLVSADTKAAIDAEMKNAKAGNANAFGWYWGLQDRQDQAGVVKITKGQTLSQADLYSMGWFVKGVDGNPKG
ncbi:MAG: BMP family ABC transporter substrate-binding protein [Acidimicrobiia bacterium]|nr:BMP family ABC transporter substrate-binding protein [Acidimicrobiia bacterium]